MSASAEPGLSGLPTRFPIFPLGGAILLPGGNLPLNIFEPRYLQMTRDAMRTDKVIGMIQPSGEAIDGHPPIYRIGCAGRITSFAETEDGRYLITLTGICRFDLIEELTVATPYRQAIASFKRYGRDLQPLAPPETFRGCLLQALRGYFDVHDINADFAQIEAAPLDGLITSLAMICPFSPSEKQALLEAPCCESRARVLVALMEMGACGGSDRARPVTH
ncbi:MAG TPA: LON peptidase substrate-binding domain-containing protein [Geminicoccaceae bacterium]